MLPDDDAIRRRAYEIWEREGRPEGREGEHWRMAVAELTSRSETNTQEVPAQRMRGPAQLGETSPSLSGAAEPLATTSGGDADAVPAAPSPDPESDPLELAKPTDRPTPRKRNSAGRGAKRPRPDTASPLGADTTKASDRTR